VISALLSRASAALLLLGGVALLFAPDVILPRLIPGFPAAGAWLGQLLAAAWLALAALNWLSRSLLLGGIYGRSVVLANAALYFVSALVLLRALVGREASAGLWVAFAPVALLAGAYVWLLLRGPAERDFQAHRRPRRDVTTGG
jgi:hypothetical protein